MQGLATEMERQHIRTAACPRCMLCGSEGEVIHSEQPDRLFGAPGNWTFKRCLSAKCELIWLDPMPLPEDIGKAYANYYTHANEADNARPGLLKRAYQAIKRGYLAGKYNCLRETTSFAVRAMGKLLYLLPGRRGEVDRSVRCLPVLTGGRLLDVGCGSGGWLSMMREFGWKVSGVDFDENAVNVARKAGLDVNAGTLEQQNYPSGSFDAVTLNHVIEHVPDPMGTLAECARILRPGGKLILFTPNGASFGHRIFKNSWRGLEPPRHLQVFSPEAMAALLRKAGFAEASVKTHNSEYVIKQSQKLSSGDTGLRGRLYCKALTSFEGVLLKLDGSVGECLQVIAVKR